MRSWWKMSECGWAHKWQTSSTQTYKNLFPHTSASISVMTMLRCNFHMYVFFVYNNIFSHSLFCWQLTRGYFPNSPCNYQVKLLPYLQICFQTVRNVSDIWSQVVLSFIFCTIWVTCYWSAKQCQLKLDCICIWPLTSWVIICSYCICSFLKTSLNFQGKGWCSIVISWNLPCQSSTELLVLCSPLITVMYTFHTSGVFGLLRSLVHRHSFSQVRPL
jgi:hypothetical protein